MCFFFWGGAGHRGLDKRRVFRAGVVGTNQLNRAAAKSYRTKLALINKPQKILDSSRYYPDGRLIYIYIYIIYTFMYITCTVLKGFCNPFGVWTAVIKWYGDVRKTNSYHVDIPVMSLGAWRAIMSINDILTIGLDMSCFSLFPSIATCCYCAHLPSCPRSRDGYPT